MSSWTPGPAWLFCPADRPDRYRKALIAADIVILDLEDAVKPSAREAARDAVRAMAREGALDPDRTVLRINGGDTQDHTHDLTLLTEVGIDRVMLAKSEDPQVVEQVRRDVVLLVETPRGIARASTLAACANVVALMWGADDLVAGLGGTSSRHAEGHRQGTYRDIARHARCTALIAAKSNELLAIDAVHMDLSDSDGLATECEDAVASGFDATAAIHPSQVPTIRSAFMPTQNQVDWATRLLAHAGDDRGVTTFDGRMVDGPIYSQAERVLRLASATNPQDGA